MCGAAAVPQSKGQQRAAREAATAESCVPWRTARGGGSNGNSSSNPAAVWANADVSADKSSSEV